MVKKRHVISSVSNPSASNPSASNQLNVVYDVRKGEYVYKHNMRRINPKLGANKLGANNMQLEYNPANYGNGANYTAVSTSAAAPQEQIDNYAIKHFRTTLPPSSAGSPSAGGRRRRKTRKQRRTIKRRNRKQ